MDYHVDVRGPSSHYNAMIYTSFRDAMREAASEARRAMQYKALEGTTVTVRAVPHGELPQEPPRGDILAQWKKGKRVL